MGPETKTTKAIAYIRRSAKSDARTVSIDTQREAVRRYCEANGFALVAEVAHDGVSGSKRSRFDDVKAAVSAFGASVVVTYHHDRFARDLAGGLDTLAGYARRGVVLHVVGTGAVEVETSDGFLKTSMHLLLAEHHRRVVGEKTRDSLALRRRQGRRYSHVLPYGFAADAAGRLVEVEEEQATIGRALDLRAGGLSLRAVAAKLSKEGRVARNGRPFAAQSLAGILGRVSDRPIADKRAA